eukprot:142709-Alexandrium_andersonii.AAC.1
MRRSTLYSWSRPWPKEESALPWPHLAPAQGSGRGSEACGANPPVGADCPPAAGWGGRRCAPATRPLGLRESALLRCLT